MRSVSKTVGEGEANVIKVFGLYEIRARKKKKTVVRFYVSLEPHRIEFLRERPIFTGFILERKRKKGL